MALFGIVITFLVVRVVGDLNRSHERARLVRSLVKEHSRVLAAADLQDSTPELKKPWPNDFLMLEGWLVVQAARGKSPGEIRQNLLALQKYQLSLSQEMRVTIGRWMESLERWAHESSSPIATAAEALQRGRHRFLEAQGYAGVGHEYDAAVLYLWAAHGLTRAIELGKSDVEFAEALYLLGVIYLTLRHSLPGLFHGEQMLYACSDLYPSSIWASRANAARHLGIR